MIMAIDWVDKIAEELVTFSFVAVLGGAAGFLWANIKQQHELDLKAVERFRDLYGEWFATWKCWEDFRDKNRSSSNDPTKVELLTRATNIEGSFEVLMVKIASSRHLNDLELRHLGRFREGYQRLRECIEDNEELPFRVQYKPDQVKAYVAFKALSVEFARLLRGRGSSWRPKSWRRPTLDEAQETMVKVTSWRTTGNRKDAWWSDAGTSSATNAVAVLKTLQKTL
jgi:hypothetical protein